MGFIFSFIIFYNFIFLIKKTLEREGGHGFIYIFCFLFFTLTVEKGTTGFSFSFFVLFLLFQVSKILDPQVVISLIFNVLGR
jgi:hypothetical protein